MALANSSVLVLFNPNPETVVSADASFKLGAVLLQRQHDGELKPIAFISSLMTPNKCRYAQLGKRHWCSRGHVSALQTTRALDSIRTHRSQGLSAPLQLQTPGRTADPDAVFPAPHDALQLYRLPCPRKKAPSCCYSL